MTPPAIPVFVVDAFAEGPFSGNPAGVCVLGRPAPEEWMAAVAAELRHSETAFVDLSARPVGLRWFTPAVEVDLCGHATLAAAHVLLSEGLAHEEPLAFATRSGVLTARPGDVGITLTLPADPAREAPEPEGLAEALGAAPVWVGRSREDLVAELPAAAAVTALAPDLEALVPMAPRGVIVTAPGDGDDDYVLRFFCPAAGVPEDPVTGSAQCAIAHRWAERLGRPELSVRQVSARGGRLRVRPGDGVVEITGRAVTVLAGRITGP